jgi:predicted DNA-binding transcriptional regulator YafY
VDTTAWRGSTENLSVLPVVQDAVSRDRKLAFRYKRMGQETVDRTVDPLGLVAKGSTWYLVAKTPDGFRTYRLSRMQEARMLDKAAERPAHFDLAAYWKLSTEQFKESWKHYEATLRMEPRAAQWARMWRIVSPVDEEGAPDKHRTDDDWVTLRIQFDHEEEACFLALGLGSRVEVVAPASLQERVAAEVSVVFKRQQKSSLKNSRTRMRKRTLKQSFV